MREDFDTRMDRHEKTVKEHFELYQSELRDINTKLCELEKTVSDHQKKVEPYIQALTGLKALSHIGMVIGGLAVGAVALKDLFKWH